MTVESPWEMIERASEFWRTAAVDTTVAAGDEIDARGYVAGSVMVSAGITSLAFYASHTSEGTFVKVYDTDTAEVSVTVATGGVYELPPQILSIPFLKFVSNVAGIVSVYLKG